MFQTLDISDMLRILLSESMELPKTETKKVKSCPVPFFDRLIHRNEKLRNPIDGSFSMNVTDVETAKELILYAVQLGLTVEGDGTASFRDRSESITNIIPGDTVFFGTSKKFDIIYAPSSTRRGLRPSQYNRMNEILVDEEGNGVQNFYDDVKDFDKIGRAIRQLAEEKKTLLAEMGEALVKGDLPCLPTYATLKLDKIGQKYVNKAKVENNKETIKKQQKNTYWETGTTSGCYCTNDTTHIRIANDFIKIGYNYIPVFDNQTIVFHV